MAYNRHIRKIKKRLYTCCTISFNFIGNKYFSVNWVKVYNKGGFGNGLYLVKPSALAAAEAGGLRTAFIRQAALGCRIQGIFKPVLGYSFTIIVLVGKSVK